MSANDWGTEVLGKKKKKTRGAFKSPRKEWEGHFDFEKDNRSPSGMREPGKRDDFNPPLNITRCGKSEDPIKGEGGVKQDKNFPSFGRE